MKKINNKNRDYILLYYTCFILSITCFFLTNIMCDENVYSLMINLFIILNIVFVVINSIGFIIKTKYEFTSIVMPISYIVFVFIVGIISVIYNNYVVISYMHLSHFFSFIVVYYLLLNIYTILCIKNISEKKKTKK